MDVTPSEVKWLDCTPLDITPETIGPDIIDVPIYNDSRTPISTYTDSNNETYNIYATYIHGSENSTDVDIFYVFDRLPSQPYESKKFCSAVPEENRNIIVINDGVVTDCYKGTPDEVNNALYQTYYMHEQKYPLLINRTVTRDVNIKKFRAVRIILSYLSRCQYRTEIKNALKSDWTTRLNVLKNIDLCTINYDTLNNNMTGADILKNIAFQIGQASALMLNIEVYTKNSIATTYPELRPFLLRKPTALMNIHILNTALHHFTEKLLAETYDINGNTVKFNDRWFDLINECYI